MTPRQIAALALGAIAITTAAVIEIRDEKPITAQERCDTYARLARLPDGGRGYVCDVVVDAGEPDCAHIRPPEVCHPTFITERRVLTRSTHVRAVRDDGSCLIREPLPGLSGGFKAPRFFGVGNRFPRAWAVGAGCEEVAGQVDSREDGEADEAVLLSRDAGTREGGSR